MMKFRNILIGFALLFGGSEVVLSQTNQENSCVLVQKLAANLGCVGTVAGGDATKPFSDEIVSNTFGPSDCAAVKKLEDDKATQKKECQSWMAEQKRELGSRYITGSCKLNCSPCESNQSRCSTVGEIRFRLDNRK